MPSFSDYLQAVSGSYLAPQAGKWVRLVNNSTSTAYVSTGATDATGLFTVNNVPAGLYTVYQGPTSGGAWTATGDTAYEVAPTNLGWFNVQDYGADPTGSVDATSAFNTAITAAGTGTVFIPKGTYTVDTLALSGKSCVFQGVGDGSVLQAKTGITGAVIDFTSYTWPTNFSNRREFANFSIIGDNTAGTAKKGIKMPTPAGIAGLTFRNISISNTGGAPLDVGAAEICSFYDITLNQPVSANANNVPYLLGTGAFNGNRFFGLGLRSITTNAEGVGGVIRMVDDGTFFPTYNKFVDTWFEFPHIPTNGTLIFCGGYKNVFEDTQFFDEAKVSGVTGTSYFYMNKAGNVIRGVIPGGGIPNTTTGVDLGVVLNSSGNRVEGLKGGSQVAGSNVQINATFGYNYVELGGNELGTANVAFTDNSAVSTNVLIDNSESALSLYVGGLRRLVVDVNGATFYRQIYPGDEAGGIQGGAGLMHAAGVPSNSNGNNTDWCISDNGHLYFRTGGSWVQKI